jgi:hypothetical protein
MRLDPALVARTDVVPYPGATDPGPACNDVVEPIRDLPADARAIIHCPAPSVMTAGRRRAAEWGCKPKPQKIPSMPDGSVVTVSVLPEVVEAIGSELSIEGGVLDILMSEVELDGAGVLAVVGEFEAG